ncbi:MAG: acyltransferase [Hyphomicrobiales bacterium]|nr:acyltransferase [Hyphomicrobiales bacterium]MCP5000740.1 acyltransferase [Hyphomicrobiales bacterium]
MIKATLYQVQYLRAFAALAVFYYHIAATQKSLDGASGVRVIEIGAGGVDLFFVISGFIMAKIVWERPVTSRDFLFRRIIRIVPLYWTATLLVFAIALVTPSLLGSTRADFLQLVHSLLFVPYGINPDTSVPVLLVGWTLNYEMYFYLLVALFAGQFADRSLMKLSIALVVLVALGLLFDPANRYLQFYLDPIVLEFAFGIGVFHFRRSQAARLPDWHYQSAFACIVAAMIVFHAFDPGDMRALFWGAPAALLLLSSLQILHFRSEPLRVLGDSSYALYILHLFVIMGFLKVLSPAMSQWDIQIPWEIGYLAMTVILIVASVVVHFTFERPASRVLSTKKTAQAHEPT